MKRILHLITIPLIFIGTMDLTIGQTPCPTPTTPADNDTPPGCTICQFPMTGSTNGYTAGPLTNGNYGCGALWIDNEQYVVFIANSPCVSFSIDANNCTPASGNWSGLQGFIFDLGLTTTFDCTNDCQNNGNPNPAPFSVNTCGLTPGQAYFLVIDGCAGAICDFTVTATGTQGGDFVSIQPAGPYCEEDNTTYTLTVNPPGGTFIGPVDPSGSFNPSVLGPGTHTVTYEYTNAYGCFDDDMIDIVVHPTPVVTLDPAGPFCENDPSTTLTFSPPGGTWSGPVGSGGNFDPGAAGPGVHTITYEYSDGNGCTDDASIDIEVNPNPDVSLDPIPDFCDDEPTYTIVFSPPGGTWSGTGTTNGTIDPGALGPGTYDVTYSVTNADGCSDEETVNFEIFPAPTVTLDPAGPFCEKDPPVVLNSSPPGGTWTGPVGSGGTFDPGAAGPGTHTITYEYTSADGCMGDATIDIVVSPNPTVTIDPIADLCTDDSPVVLNFSPPGGTWSGNGTTNGTVDPGALGPGTYTVTYSYTNPSGCTEEATINFEIFPAPTVTLDPAGPFCEDDSPVVLTHSPPGGTFSGPVGPGGNFDPAAAGPGTHSITYDYTSADGCSGSAMVDIVVNPSPDVTIDPIPDFCEDEPPFTINASPSGGTWSGTGTTNGTIDPGSLGPGNYTVTYTYTDAFGCTNDETVNFAVFPAPTVTIDPAGPFCENDGAVNLTGTPPGGTWGGAAPGGTFDPGAVGPGTHNVTYSYTSPDGCMDDTDIDIVVNPAPMVSIDPAGPFCENDAPVVLTASPSGGTWTGPVGPGGGFDPGTAGPGSHTITYSYTNSFGCTEMDDITIDVNPLPIVMISPPSDICENDPAFSLDASPPGGIWGGDVGPGGQLDPSVLGPGTYTATYEYTDGNGCIGDDMISFTINPAPMVTLDPAGPFCEEDAPVTLTFSPPGGTWSGPVNSNGVFDPAFAGPGTHTVTYTVINAFGCEDEESIDIEVNPNPNPMIDDPGPICEMDPTIVLTASPSGGTWGGAAGPGGSFDPSVLGTGTHVVTYDYTDGNGCSGSTQLSIQIFPLPIVSIQPAGPFCENDPPSDLVGSPPGGNWFGDVDPTGTVDPSLLGAGSYSVTYEYTDGNGCTNSTDMTYVINPAPVVILDPAGPFCEDDPVVTLNAIPAGGTWGGTVNSSGQFDPMTLGPGFHPVTYTYTNSFGCTEMDEYDVEVIELVDILFLSPQNYCATDDPIFLDADPIGGTWGGDVGPGGELDPATLGPGTYTVSYTYVDPFGCDVTENFTINISAGPTVVIDPAGPFCENDGQVTLTATPVGGTWYGEAGPNGGFDPEYLGPGVWTVEYEYTDFAGCTGIATLDITVEPSPFIDFDLPDPVCEDVAPINLTASPPGGIWGGVANASGQVNPQVLGPGFFQATYTYTDGNGCSSTENIDVEVVPLPEIIFDYTGPFCLEDALQFLEVYPFGGTWSGDVDAFGEFNPIDLGPGVFNATYEYEDFYGCSSTASTPFEILNPVDIFFLGDSTFCASQGPVTLQATPTGANGSWSGAIVNANGQIDPSSLTPGTYTVTYNYIDQGGCEASEDLTVTISPPPVISINGDLEVCQTSGIITYTATPVGGSWGGVANANGEVDANALAPGTHIVSYTVPYANGCLETFEQTITVDPPPTAEISGTGTVCPGGNAEADLTVVLTGAGPWQLTYSINGAPQVPVTVNSSPYTITTDQPGDYAIVSVTDAEGCTNSGTGAATVQELTPLSITGLDGTCDGTNTNFTLTFTINGGDPGSYMVAGVTGTLTGNMFTSDPIASGTNVMITVSDNSGCAPVSDNILIDCACETEVGSMNTGIIRNCGPGTLTAVYDPDGEFLDADDLVQYVLHTNPGVSLGTVIAISNAPTFSFDPGTMLYGTTYYISAIAGSDDGTGNVDLTDNCLKVAAGTPIIFYEIPEATLTGTTDICEGESTDLSINLTGQSPWTIRYFNGTDTVDLNGITTNPYVLTVTPGATTTYEVVAVRNNFCDGVADGSATVTVNDAPVVTDITTTCDGTYTNFTVTFTITGGDPNSYMVNGIPGTLTGNTFTSEPITSPGSFSGTVSDANGCAPVDIMDNVDCGCLTTVGTMGTSTIRICGPGTAVANYDSLLQELDADDAIMFVLHTNSGNTLGTILGTNTIPEFTFDPGTMMYGTTYYISAVAGNGDGNGGVDLNDPCLDVSAGTPVIFRRLPTAMISGDQTICFGDTATLTIDLTGAAPWAVTYNNGSVNRNITPTSSPWTIQVVPNATTTYTVVSVRDANCTNSGTGSAVVTVNSPPTATLTPQTEICNTDENNNITVLDLYSLIVAGDNTGSWEDLDNSGASGSFDALDFIGLTPGDYRFEYTTNSAMAPCQEVSYLVTVTVSDCSCPSVATAPPAVLCNDAAVLDLADITITTEPGFWSIVSTPNGSNPGTISNNVFNATGRDTGVYEIEFRLNQAPPAGCPEASVQIITVLAPPSASVTPNFEVCNTDQNNDPTTVDFSTLITAGDNNGTWVDLDNSGAVGNFPTLDFAGIAEGDYRFEYRTNSATAPCNESTYLVTITVRDCSCPSVATIAPAPLCSNNALLDLSSITITTEPGSWAITSAPNGSNSATLNGNIFDATGRDAGTYELQFTLSQTPPAGCPVSSTQTITVHPEVSAGQGPGSLSYCSDAVGSINLFDQLNGESPGGSWTVVSGTPGNAFNTNSGVLNAAALNAGTYEFEYYVAGTDPCPDDSETITVRIENPVNAGSVLLSPALCEGETEAYQLMDLLQGADAGGTWSEISASPSVNGAFDPVNGTFDAEGQVAGTYTFRYEVLATAPCENQSVEVQVTIHPNPVADAGEDKGLTCNTRRAVLGGPGTSTGTNYTYSWSGNGLSDPSLLNPEVSGPGIFVLTVTDTQTGCTATDEVEINQNEDLPTLNANSIDLTCFGSDNGVIQVNNVTGGTSPYLYSLNGGPFTSDNIFTGLPPGNYNLAVEDANGCEDEVTFVISEPEELTVTLSVNLNNLGNVVSLGDSVLLTANVDGTFDTIYWQPAEHFAPCDPEQGLEDCTKHWVIPTDITTYSVTVVDENGCQDSDQITVRVRRDRNVYIPSGFSPNGDGVNDGFRIYTDKNVEKVKSFLVFDRWGELVYEYYDFDPDDPAGSWDGNFRGQPMNSAVFAYFAEIEFKDGKVELYKGDVTLVR